MHHVLIRRGCLGIVLMGMVLLVACGSTVTDALPTNALKVLVDIKDYHQGTTSVSVHFSDKANNTVEFVHGETVVCDGVYLKYDSGYYEQLIGYGAYVGNVPLQPKGGTYTVTLTPAGGKAATIPVGVVYAPITIRQPANGATVVIPTTATPLTIQYAPSGLSNSSVITSATDSRAHVAVSGALADTGAVNFANDAFKQFAPGPGNLGVARVTSIKPATPSFQEVDIWYENITVTQITWQ